MYDILHSAYYTSAANPQHFLHVPITGIGETAELNMIIAEVSTVYGRCYMTKMMWRMRHNDYLLLALNLSIPERLQVFVHEEFNEIGLNNGFWPINPPSFTLTHQDVATVVLKKRLHIYQQKQNDDLVCTKQKNYSYPKCVVDWARETYKNLWNNSQAGRLLVVNYLLPSVDKNFWTRLLVSLWAIPCPGLKPATVQNTRGSRLCSQTGI